MAGEQSGSGALAPLWLWNFSMPFKSPNSVFEQKCPYDPEWSTLLLTESRWFGLIDLVPLSEFGTEYHRVLHRSPTESLPVTLTGRTHSNTIVRSPNRDHHRCDRWWGVLTEDAFSWWIATRMPFTLSTSCRGRAKRMASNKELSSSMFN